MRKIRAIAAGAGPYWALGFAGLHLYWAGGGRIGVPDRTGPMADRSWFLAYDLVAAGVFLTAAVIGRLLLGERLSCPQRRSLRRLTLLGSVLALMRAWVGLAQDAVLVLLLHRVDVGMAYDLWFLVAGLIFLPVARWEPSSRSELVTPLTQEATAPTPPTTAARKLSSAPRKMSTIPG